MAQNSYETPDVDGPTWRAHLGPLFEAIATNNSGDDEPSVTYPFMPWADTTSGLLKIRNAGNGAWITVGTLDTTNLGLATLGANTFTGPQDYAYNTLQRAVLRDTSFVVNELGNLQGGAALAIDCRAGNFARNSGVILSVNPTTISFTNAPPAGTSFKLTLRARNFGQPFFNPTFPAVLWPGGVAPTFTALGYDVLKFQTIDGGSTWCGQAIGLDLK